MGFTLKTPSFSNPEASEQCHSGILFFYTECSVLSILFFSLSTLSSFFRQPSLSHLCLTHCPSAPVIHIFSQIKAGHLHQISDKNKPIWTWLDTEAQMFLLLPVRTFCLRNDCSELLISLIMENKRHFKWRLSYVRVSRSGVHINWSFFRWKQQLFVCRIHFLSIIKWKKEAKRIFSSAVLLCTCFFFSHHFPCDVIFWLKSAENCHLFICFPDFELSFGVLLDTLHLV